MNNQIITGLIVLLFLAPVVISALIGRKVKLDNESLKVSESKWRIVCGYAPFSYLGHYKYRWAGERRAQADAELATMAENLCVSPKGLGARMAIIDMLSMSLLVVGLSMNFNTAAFLLVFLCFWYLFSLVFIGLTTRSTRTQPQPSPRLP